MITDFSWLDEAMALDLDADGRVIRPMARPLTPKGWGWVASSLMNYGRTVEALAEEIDEPLPRLLGVITNIEPEDQRLYRRILIAITDWAALSARDRLMQVARDVGIEPEPEAVPPPKESWFVNLWTKGSAGRRNRLARVYNPQDVDFFGTPGRVDEYLTVWCYPAEFEAHVKAHGTVEAYRGPVRATGLHFDFDGDGGHAFEDVKQFVADPRVRPICRVFFSGSKGFHIHVDIDDAPPAVEIPQLVAGSCAGFAGKFKSFDRGVYDFTRLWRIPNSVNSKSGLHKIPLLLADLIGPHAMTLEQIKERALRQRSKTQAFIEFIARCS